MKKIILISGDPNSINSELIYKSLKKIKKNIKKKIYLISNYKLLNSQLKKLKYNLNISKVKNLNQKLKNNNIKVIDINLKSTSPFDVKKKEASNYVMQCLNVAHNLAIKESNISLINCPISKQLLKRQKIGVTEYLASKSKIHDDSVAMLIFNEKLSVCPITTHIDVNEIRKKLKKVTIIKKIKTIDKWYKHKYKKKPKIGILGLNPHNAELRNNSEEKKIIIPAINKLKKNGILVNGPLVADTVFINDFKKYNVIVGMYHDQVLTPFKTIFKFNAINVTLGLKYTRVSPDHGVATNLIGKNKANPESLIKCINFVNKF